MTDTDYFDILMMKRYRAMYFDKDNKLLGISHFDAGFEEARRYAFTYRSVSTARIELYKVMGDGSFDFLSDWRVHNPSVGPSRGTQVKEGVDNE